MRVDLLVEGMTDAAVARKLLPYAGHTCGDVYGQRGIGYVREKITAFNQMSLFGNPLLTLVDFMDTRLECPPAVVAEWLPVPAPQHLLRVAVRELESWLLADREGVAEFLRVPLSKVPHLPEDIPDPKQALIALARRSRLRARREAIVPHEGMSASVGPGYTAEIETFVQNHWSIDAARALSVSLDRCLVRLAELQV